VEDGRFRRGSERKVILPAKLASVPDFELFVDGLDFLSKRERDRLKLAGDEVFDNIVKHAAPEHSHGIHTRAARRGGSVLLAFYFRSPSFAAFAAGYGDPEPLFDPAHRRWRGLGLVMCHNLARKVRFRPGHTVDRIFLEFDRVE
jgi:anti-sigma regulatory factor (Ser/Thr protein kinase)